MSFAHHFLHDGSTLRSLAAMGSRSAVAVEALGGKDTLTLSFTRNIGDGWLFTPYQTVRLLDAAGQTRFRGRLARRSRSASGKKATQTYLFRSPMLDLESITYRQQSYFASNPTLYGSTLALDYTPRVILHRTAAGAPLAVKAQVQAVLAYANTQGAGILYDVDDIPDVQPPEDQQQDQRCADVLRSELAWMPHIDCRWDYAPLQATLLFGDTTEGTTFGAVQTLDLAVTRVEEFQGEPCDELVVPQVRISYLYEQEATDGTTGAKRRWAVKHTDASTIANGGLGIEEATIVLRPPVWDGSGYGDGEPLPADGLAAALHKAYGRLYFDLSWSRSAQEVDWTHRVGQRCARRSPATSAPAR
jgi:hypothetical protein